MQLIQTHRQHWLWRIISGVWRRRRMRIISIVIGMMLVPVALYVALVQAYDHRDEIKTRVVGPFKEFVGGAPHLIPQHMAYGLLADPEELLVDMKYENFMHLAHQRQTALDNGYLVSGDDAFVSAAMTHKGEKVDVKMRLKGDWTDHLQGKKWSFRVKVKGDDTLFGMEQFSLQHPKTRNYIYEWLFHEALRREDVIALRYDFVRLKLNGDNLGIYALEEHCDKLLIEHNQRREGPIVRFNESLLWDERFQQSRRFPDSEPNGNGTYLASDIDSFQTSRILADPAQFALFKRAVYLLESFRRGEMKTSEVFDTDKLARYFAICDLMGNRHPSMWQNIRFYYNPVTSRLEPIGFDANGGVPLKTLSATLTPLELGREETPLGKFRSTFFHDPEFFRLYTRALERVSDPSYLDELLASAADRLERNLRIIYSEFPAYRFSKGVLYKNQGYIKSVLNPVKGLHAHFRESAAGQLELEVGGIHTLPMEVDHVRLQELKIVPEKGPTIVPAQRQDFPVEYQTVSFKLPESLEWTEAMVGELRLVYRVVGCSNVLEVPVFAWPAMGEPLPVVDFVRQEPNSQTFDFLHQDDASREIEIEPGQWNLDRNLIIPSGYTVRCSSGTRLNLSNSACILSFSPLMFQGSEAEPIVLCSDDSTGQGLIVMGAAEWSVFEHVRCENLANPSQGGWTMTGAVTFYESPVRITRCRFERNRCEDALNIIRAEFAMGQTSFANTFSDAFDGDFVKGTVKQVSFVDLGNDGLDVSGSVIEMEDIYVQRAGDKGISGGEDSKLTGKNIRVDDAEIAVASKDGSEVVIEGLSIKACRVGLTAFQKKPEFGPGVVRVVGEPVIEAELPYLVEDASTVVVGGETIAADRDNVKGMLYGAEYGKSSR